MGFAQRVPEDRPTLTRLSTLPPPGWVAPPQYIPPAAPLSARLTRILSGAGFLLLLYLVMSEQALRLLPFVMLVGWLWLRADRRVARSEGFGKDW